MTLGSVIDLMRGVLDDDFTTSFWPDADLIQFVDAAQKLFVGVAPDDAVTELQSVTTLSLTQAPTGETVGGTALPADFYQFRLARVKQSATGTYYTARTIPLERLYSLERAGSTGRATPVNPAVALWRDTIYAAPATITTLASGIQMFYLMTVTELSAVGDTPQVNDMHHAALADWALGLAFGRIGDTARAQLYGGNFTSYIQAIGGRWTDRMRQRPVRERVGGDVPRSV